MGDERARCEAGEAGERRLRLLVSAAGCAFLPGEAGVCWAAGAAADGSAFLPLRLRAELLFEPLRDARLDASAGIAMSGGALLVMGVAAAAWPFWWFLWRWWSASRFVPAVRVGGAAEAIFLPHKSTRMMMQTTATSPQKSANDMIQRVLDPTADTSGSLRRTKPCWATRLSQNDEDGRHSMRL